MKLGPYALGPNGTPENGIYTGDSFKLGKAIPAESVDLILCDPVWWEFYQYSWLASIAERILKPGCSVIAQVGNDYRYQAETIMRMGKLSPQPVLTEIYGGGSLKLWHRQAFASVKPYLWFRKEGKPVGWMRLHVKGYGPDKSIHAWGDSGAMFKSAILRLTKLGQIVFDPFAGGAIVSAMCKETGRQWLAFELDPDVAERGRERVRRQSAALLVEEYDQLSLGRGGEKCQYERLGE